MSPIHERIVQLKLHVKLQAPGPGERFAVLGSHEALGCWNPSSGLQLEWKGNAWETQDPVAISPCERVEFKFVRVRLGGIEWESGPNRVTEFPNYKGELCLQGIFNGESILQPSEPDEGISTTELVQREDDKWKSRYHEALSTLMALQKDITLRQEEQERRRAQHNEVREELRKQIAEAQEEADELSISLKAGQEELQDALSDLAPDISSIPSPSFTSSASWQSTPKQSSVGKSSSSSFRRNQGLYFKGPRLEMQKKPLPGSKAMPAPTSPPPPVGRHSSVLESWYSTPRDRRPVSGRTSSRSENALAALRAAKGASPVSPHSEDEAVRPGEHSQPKSSREMCSWSRSEPGLRGSASGNFGKYERVVRSNSQQSQLSEEDASANTVIASKEVLAAFATAKARFEGRSEG